MRRLFRIYDVDRDGLLSDDELNAFQLQSFDVNLSQEDHNSLRTVSQGLVVTYIVMAAVWFGDARLSRSFPRKKT